MGLRRVSDLSGDFPAYTISVFTGKELDASGNGYNYSFETVDITGEEVIEKVNGLLGENGPFSLELNKAIFEYIKGDKITLKDIETIAQE